MKAHIRPDAELELDEPTLQAIEEGEAQADRGEARPWEELRAELPKKYLSTKEVPTVSPPDAASAPHP